MRRIGLSYKTLIFWLHAPSDVLNPRLDVRVDKMVEVRRRASVALRSSID